MVGPPGHPGQGFVKGDGLGFPLGGEDEHLLDGHVGRDGLVGQAVDDSVEELRRQRVGTMKGTNMAEVIATLGVPPENVDDDIPTGGLIPALRSGRVTAVVWGVESAIASQKDDPDLVLGTFVGSPGSLAFGVRKTDPALLAALNAYVEAFRKSPAWSRLAVKYFGESAPAILKSARGE